MNWQNQLPQKIGLLFSGGVDSTILLHALLESGFAVTPFFVRCGLNWEAAEHHAIESILHRLACERLRPLVELDMPVAELYGNHWSITGRGAPDDTTPDEAVHLPGRNALLTMKAALWCHQQQIPALALATLRNNPFEDASQPFFSALNDALANGGQAVQLVRPFDQFTKADILDDWPDAPISLTFSCLAPRQGLHCDRCNKCGERRKALAYRKPVVQILA